MREAKTKKRLLRHFVSCSMTMVGFSLRFFCLRSLCLVLSLRPQTFQETIFMRNGGEGWGKIFSYQGNTARVNQKFTQFLEKLLIASVTSFFLLPGGFRVIMRIMSFDS
jgi:hypothetical protein